LADGSPWWPLIAWLGIPFLLVDFSLAPLFSAGLASLGSNHWFMPALTGCVCLVLVQVALASFCLALGPGAYWQRLAVYAIVLGTSLFCWWLGHLLSFFIESDVLIFGTFINGRPVELNAPSSLQYFCSLPIVALGFQSPFWFSRVLHGWRLLPPPSSASQGMPQNERLSMRDLLVATAIIAVCLAIARLPTSLEDTGAEDALFITVGYGCAFAIQTYLTASPLLVIFFRTTELPRAWSLALGFALLIATVVSLAIGASLPAGMPLSLNWQPFVGATLIAILYTAGISVGLTILRYYGWTLARRGNDRLLHQA